MKNMFKSIVAESIMKVFFFFAEAGASSISKKCIHF
jgi:hypothetical protein